MKHIRTLYKKLYSLKLSVALVIASPTTPTKAVAFLIYLLVINNMTDEKRFEIKSFKKFKKILFCPQPSRKLISLKPFIYAGLRTFLLLKKLENARKSGEFIEN